MATRYREDLNVGLPSNFVLDSSGKFKTVGGDLKVIDNLRFMLHFIGWYRVFLREFVPRLLWFYQKSSNVLTKYKNIFRIQLLRAAQNYAPFANIVSVDMTPQFRGDRKNLFIDIVFNFKLEKDPPSPPRRVRFVKAIQ